MINQGVAVGPGSAAVILAGQVEGESIEIWKF